MSLGPAIAALAGYIVRLVTEPLGFPLVGPGARDGEVRRALHSLEIAVAPT